MQAEAEGQGWQGGGDRNRIHTKFKITDKYSLLSENDLTLKYPTGSLNPRIIPKSPKDSKIPESVFFGDKIPKVGHPGFKSKQCSH